MAMCSAPDSCLAMAQELPLDSRLLRLHLLAALPPDKHLLRLHLLVALVRGSCRQHRSATKQRTQTGWLSFPLRSRLGMVCLPACCMLPIRAALRRPPRTSNAALMRSPCVYVMNHTSAAWYRN